MTEEQAKAFQETILRAMEENNKKLEKRLDNMQLAMNGLVATNASIEFRLDELTKQTAENTKQIRANTQQLVYLTEQMTVLKMAKKNLAS